VATGVASRLASARSAARFVRRSFCRARKAAGFQSPCPVGQPGASSRWGLYSFICATVTVRSIEFRALTRRLSLIFAIGRQRTQQFP
jgi:hypothetical protein